MQLSAHRIYPQSVSLLFLQVQSILFQLGETIMLIMYAIKINLFLLLSNVKIRCLNKITFLCQLKFNELLLRRCNPKRQVRIFLGAFSWLSFRHIQKSQVTFQLGMVSREVIIRRVVNLGIFSFLGEILSLLSKGHLRDCWSFPKLIFTVSFHLKVSSLQGLSKFNQRRKGKKPRCRVKFPHINWEHARQFIQSLFPPRHKR